MKVFFVTLGCKVNQYESQAMLESLLDSGFSCSNKLKNSDIIIFNSCSVTSTSDQKTRKLINKAKRENPTAIIVLTGCMVQAFPNIIDKFPNIDIALGNANKHEIIPSILNFIKNKKRIVNINSYNNNSKFDNTIIKKFGEKTRAFIKIEDGCNRFCSYCIIPYARGRVRSKPLEDIIKESTNLANSSYKEIVLVGINLSCYGQDIGLNICDAIEAVCSVKNIKRVRLGSLEPELLTPEIIKRLSNQKKLCPQFHLSLQSGCDSTLKRMNRHYTTKEYLEIVNNLRKNFHNSSITTDIMVGFPGETDKEFFESMKFAEKIGFAKMHVFSYSQRPGTKAVNLPNQIDNTIKHNRNKKMSDLEINLRDEFLKSQLNLTEEVLFETNNNNIYEGYTKNYTPVTVKSNKNICKEILNIKLESIQEHHIVGEKNF